MNGARLALWLSRIFHPFVISPLALWLGIWLTTAAATAWLWTALSLACTVLPMTLFILWQVRRGRFADRDVSVRDQRGPLYRLALVEIGVFILLMNVLAAPPIVFAATYGALLGIGIAAIINRHWTKISIHTLAATGSALLFLPLSPALLLAFGLAALAVAWSRVVLGQHTPGQVLLGAGLAGLCTVTLLRLYGFW